MRVTLRRVDDRIEIHLPSARFTQMEAHYLEEVVDHKGITRAGGLTIALDLLTRGRFVSGEHRLIATDASSRGVMDDLYTPYPADGARCNARLRVQIEGKVVDIPVRKGGNWEGHYEL